MAVVTGASGTLGRLVVTKLSALGVGVLAVSQSGTAPGCGEVASVAADLSSDDSIATIHAALPEGSLAMAVHCVGLAGSPGVADIPPAMFADAVDLKVGGLVRVLRSVDHRVSRGSRIVAVGGHLGSEPSEHAPLAGVANAGLASLVRQLVRPLGSRGATVHLVAPGPFESERTERLIAAKAAGAGVDVSTVRSELNAGTPLGHMLTPDLIADLIVSLLHPSADALTGSTLSADGGLRHGLF